MRSMITLLAAGVLFCWTTTSQAGESEQVLNQMGLAGMQQVSDTEGDTIRGAALVPSISLQLEKLVVVDLSIARSTTVFVQNDLALDLNVLVGSRLNLAIGNIGD